MKNMKNAIKFIAIGLVVLQLFSLAAALKISSVDTIPNEVEPGKIIDLIIEIENNLNVDVDDVEIALILTPQVLETSVLGNVMSEGVPLSPQESSTKFIDEIEDDDEKNIKFSLIADADAEAGVYKIPVKLNYKIDDVAQTEKMFTVSVTINSKPNLVLSAENDNGVFLKNQKNEVEIVITNTGLNKAKLLEIGIQGSGIYNVLSSQNVYIGDLESDDFDSAKFEVFLKDSGSVSLPVTLKYRDSTNREYSETEILQLRVYSTDEAIELGLIEKSRTTLYIIVVVVVIVLWFIWRKIKKRRKRKGGN